MPGNETLFSPDRWKAMLELMAETAPKAAQKFSDATNMKVGQSTAEASKVKDHEEFVVDKNELKITDVVDKLPTQGMLSPTDDGTVMPADGSFLSKDRAQKTRDANVSAIKQKYAKINEAILEEKSQRKKEKEEADRRAKATEKLAPARENLANILTSYDAVDKLEKQQAAKLAKEKQALEAKKVAQEKEADSALELALSEAGLGQMTMEAEADRVSMEADADKRDNPMSTLTDKEKGDFEFKNLEPKDKSGQAGITLLMQETGLDGGAATALMSKLKGLCG
jgi:hypothetical protein